MVANFRQVPLYWERFFFWEAFVSLIWLMHNLSYFRYLQKGKSSFDSPQSLISSERHGGCPCAVFTREETRPDYEYMDNLWIVNSSIGIRFSLLDPAAKGWPVHLWNCHFKYVYPWLICYFSNNNLALHIFHFQSFSSVLSIAPNSDRGLGSRAPPGSIKDLKMLLVIYPDQGTATAISSIHLEAVFVLGVPNGIFRSPLLIIRRLNRGLYHVGLASLFPLYHKCSLKCDGEQVACIGNWLENLVEPITN